MGGTERGLARLCLLLGDAGGPLSEPGPARSAALRVVEAVRRGAAEAELARLLEELDAELRAAGQPGGLGGYRTDPPPRPGFRPLPGITEHAVHEVLACPGVPRCARLENMTWAARLDPPRCTVHDDPLAAERIRL